MCSNENSSKDLFTVSSPIEDSMTTLLPGLEHYRLQLYHYAMAERIRLAQQLHCQHTQHTINQAQSVGHSAQGNLNIDQNFSTSLPIYSAENDYSRGLALSMALLHSPHQQINEEPKPQHSYIGLIAMAILSSSEKKLVLSDIYQHILEHYPYFRRRGPGWRNSIRHNLSLNDCFVKSGRSANGKGHYWAIHPANLDDFRRGDFRRRKAQRKVRRHMGLAVDEEPDSPSPPPLPMTLPNHTTFQYSVTNQTIPGILNPPHQTMPTNLLDHSVSTPSQGSSLHLSRKRQFDVASLLAPDDQQIKKSPSSFKLHVMSSTGSERENDRKQKIYDEKSAIKVGVITESTKILVRPNSKPANIICNWSESILVDAEPQHFPQVQDEINLRNYYVSTDVNLNSDI